MPCIGQTIKDHKLLLSAYICSNYVQNYLSFGFLSPAANQNS